MFFRGRGKTYLAERDDNAITGPSLEICGDVLTIALNTESGEHINKCGLVDSPDDRYIKSSSGTVTFEYADVAAKKFAIGVLGTVTDAGGTGSVSDEVLPSGMVDGSVYFAGGLERHRALTSVVISDGATSPTALTVTTNYTVDAVTGKITFVGDLSAFVQPFTLDYSYTDPESVSLLSASQKQYALNFEGFNLRNSNAKGSLEAYNVRFDPAALLDFQSDELQQMSLTGTMLIDPSKEATDTEFGQFGRRVGF